MVSPVEGGFIGPAPLQGQSVSMLKRHIRELYARLSKSESDKQKIADEAYLRAVDIQKECDRKLEDARVAQGKQASLIERLKGGRYLHYSVELYEMLIKVMKFQCNEELFFSHIKQNKLVEYRSKSDSANRRLLEVTQLANQAQIRFEDTNEALRSTEEKLRANEVSLIHKIYSFIR